LKIFEDIKKHCQKTEKKLTLDMSMIEELDAGSLIYLKYIVHKIKDGKKRNMELRFKAPQNIELKEKVYNSGFVTYSKPRNYVEKNKEKSKNYLTIENNDNFRIQKGSFINRTYLRKIIEFVENKKQGSKKVLYPILHEMMENTMFHAYDENDLTRPKDWYLFSECDSHTIKFFFLDTGKGIVGTARKRWHDIFKLINKDSEILKTVLEGKHRTQTKKKYRGKGLPHIYETSLNNKILNLKIISNKGCLNLNGDRDLKEELIGTLFYWEMDVEGDKNEI